MDRPVESLTVRVLLLQMLAHALIYAAQNAGNLTERALLARDTAATVAVGLNWTAFCVLSAFTTNVVNVCQLAVGRRAGDGDEKSARAAARQALVLAGGGGALGLIMAVAAGAAAGFAAGPARDAALFLAAQGLALGALLVARALTGYFAGTMRIGLRLLVAVSALAIAIHLALAWGSSQAVGAAAAQAVGRGDAQELVRVTWLGLGLAAVLAFALPWGAYALYGRATLAWLIDGNPAGGAVLAASVRLMGVLALFFVFDFAINFLAALLGAAKDQAYLLRVTAAVAAGFGLLVVALPLPPDGACLMGTFVTVQAAWVVLLLARVVTRWPVAVSPDLPAAPHPWRPGPTADCSVNRVTGPGRNDTWGWTLTARSKVQGRLSSRRVLTAEQPAMNPVDPNTGLLPPTLRALALGLLVETVVPMLTRAEKDSPVPPDQGERGTDAKAELWQDLRGKCDELSTLVLRADDPEEAAAYVLGYLPKHFEYLFELLCGQRRGRILDPVGAVLKTPHRNGKHEANHA